jgi:hypothetical protein
MNHRSPKQLLKFTSGQDFGGLLAMHLAMNSSPLTSRMKPHLENHLKTAKILLNP